MELFVALQRVDSIKNVIGLAEGEQALARREPASESGVLGNDRTSAREVTGAAIAEPSGTRGHIPALRKAELRLRTLDEPPVVMGRRRDGLGIDELSSVGTQILQITGLVGMDLQRELKSGRGARRQVDQRPERVRLLAILHAPMLD